MPPVLFTSLSFPFTRLAHSLFPAAVANGIIAGAFFFCKPYPPLSSLCPSLLTAPPLPDVIYDCMHYA